MKQIILCGFAIASISLWGCEEEPPAGQGPGGNTPDGNQQKNTWLIPRDEVFDGGPGKDGIPALTDPEFIAAVEAEYLGEGDLVLGYVVGNDARAYPHTILDWHEIINDQVGDVSISVTYCPLTGTGIGWNRNIGGKVTTFGVSGLLYNSNLIPYDRGSDSNWSQIRLDCVNGNLSGTEIETLPLVETTWKTWKEMYPGTRVVSTETGYTRTYGAYPYGSYRTNHDYIIFPIANEDNRMQSKERVHGIVKEGTARVYPLSLFNEGVHLIQEVFRQLDLVIVGSQDDNFVVSFMRDPGDGTLLSFTPLKDQYPVVMTDQEGNMWDVMGTAVSGPRMGTRLRHARSFMGYWFSFGAFYPDLTIYGES